jgi:hypothetical protein
VWAKKIRGKLHYFGPWNDPDGALNKYLAEKDALHSGRKPRPDAEALTVKQLVNKFLNAKTASVEQGRLSQLTWGDYKTATDEMVAEFGKQRLVSDLRPEDFAALRKRMAKKWGLGSVLTLRCRGIGDGSFSPWALLLSAAPAGRFVPRWPSRQGELG